MSMSLIIIEGNYGAIDVDGLLFMATILSKKSSKYTLHAELSIDGKVISSSEMVCEGTYFSNQYQFLLIYSTKRKPNKTIVALRTISNGNVNIKFHDSKHVVLSCLWSIS